jgi:hypothetical protein
VVAGTLSRRVGLVGRVRLVGLAASKGGVGLFLSKEQVPPF